MDSKIIFRLGSTEIAEGLLFLRAIDPLNEVPEAEIWLTTAVLESLSVDYMAWATLTLSDGKDWNKQVFGGMVNSVDVRGPRTLITFVGQMTELAETLQGPINGFRVPPLERIWSQLRMAGLREDQIRIAGFVKGPVEPFIVATPLPHLTVTRDVRVDDVALTSSVDHMRSLAAGLGPSEPFDSYWNASAWAMTRVQAPTLFDAETEGLARIAHALSWAGVELHYSFNRLPSGVLQSFRRDSTLVPVRRDDTMLVHAETTNRRWVRVVATRPITPDITIGDTDRFRDPVTLGALSPQDLEAIAFWSQSTQTEDPFTQVIVLVNALEFYAAGRKPTKRFAKADLRQIREAADEVLTAAQAQLLNNTVGKMQEGLTQEQIERVTHVKDNVVQQLNEPSFMARLHAAITEDGVPISSDELAILERIRTCRNRMVHGQSLVPPDKSDLEYGRALVNRMLMYRRHDPQYMEAQGG